MKKTVLFLVLAVQTLCLIEMSVSCHFSWVMINSSCLQSLILDYEDSIRDKSKIELNQAVRIT